MCPRVHPSARSGRSPRRPSAASDTLPALGVVLVSLGVVLEDVAVVGLSIIAGAGGVAPEIVLDRAAVHGLDSLL